MVDFKKRLGLSSIDKKINPIEIYDQLDRRSETGPLRPAQDGILREWWLERREEKDLILKLHTGQGKTLIGLLILQSRLNEGKGPCIYVCPNIYLVQQTCQQAEKFGIGYVRADGNSLPNEFINSEKILITHVQKVFNGKSVFGIGGRSIRVNTLILDDSHACIDFINESFKVKVARDHGLYQRLMQLFEDDLREQGEGSFAEIRNGEHQSLLPVPYWSWQDRKSEVIEALLAFSDDKGVTFTWSLIKDNIENCQCFFTGKELEISTFLSPVHQFGTFSKAEHRILMSATTQNDSFFVKGLGLGVQAVEKPLVYQNEKWSGEKMILIPGLIHELLDRNTIINRFAKANDRRRAGVVAITPSFKKADLYQQWGATIANSTNIFEQVSSLKAGNYTNTIVIVNRYDGIDLPDDSCRLLIIDSLPYAESLTEIYEEECRSNSDLVNIRIAQKIEQGLGRSVRGEKDYSVILLIGDDLIRFIKSIKSKDFFSLQTRRQIDIGLEIAEFAKEEEDKKDPLDVILELISQCIRRDDGWKEFYSKKMAVSDSLGSNVAVTEILDLERQAEESFYKNETEKAISYIQKIVDSYCNDDSAERGWYLQILARYKYKISKVDSNSIQQGAFRNNTQLLKPREGVNYQKLSFINENRTRRIKSWISSHPTYEELMMNISSILESLSFGEPAEKFEKALQDLGNAIGFLSQRPDKEFKKGPDNLWCIDSNEYFIFECKSQVEETRGEITKTETGQMNNHCAWFQQEYRTDKVKRILIIPTRSISSQGGFTHQVEIMRKGRLKLLRDNVKSFFKELKDYSMSDISDSKINEWLVSHKLDSASLKQEYTETPYQNR